MHTFRVRSWYSSVPLMFMVKIESYAIGSAFGRGQARGRRLYAHIRPYRGARLFPETFTAELIFTHFITLYDQKLGNRLHSKFSHPASVKFFTETVQY